MTLRDLTALLSVLAAIASSVGWIREAGTAQALVVELGAVSVRFSMAQQEQKPCR